MVDGYGGNPARPLNGLGSLRAENVVAAASIRQNRSPSPEFGGARQSWAVEMDLGHKVQQDRDAGERFLPINPNAIRISTTQNDKINVSGISPSFCDVVGNVNNESNMDVQEGFDKQVQPDKISANSDSCTPPVRPNASVSFSVKGVDDFNFAATPSIPNASMGQSELC